MTYFPSIQLVSKHGDHSPRSWVDLDRIREELINSGFRMPKIRTVK